MTHRLVALAAAAASVAVSAPALAQDEQIPWAGWYVGLNAGVAWGDAKSRLFFESPAGSRVPAADIAALNAPVSTGHHNHTGFTGGIEGGYNYVMGNNLLLGVETDFGFLDIKKTNSNTFQSRLLINPPVTYTLENRVKADWVWTLRPRIGYISGNWLFFGSAGLGISDIEIRTTYHDTFNPPGSASMSDSSTKTGFAGGLGVGYAFASGWSAKGEWLYTDFGKVTATTGTSNNAVNITSEGKVKANLIRFGADYRF
jgi:outer membrane immunogenic protein